MQNAEASVWGTCQARSPTLVFLAPKQSPQALQSGDVESRVGRQVAKHEAPGVGKRTDKSLRKCQSENIPRGSTVWWLTGQSSGPAQVREGKSWWQSLFLLFPLLLGICRQFGQHAKKFSCQERI